MRFLRDEAGAVTIDWVALTAGLLLVGIAIVYGIFNTGVDTAVDTITTTVQVDSAIRLGPVPNPNPN